MKLFKTKYHQSPLIYAAVLGLLSGTGRNCLAAGAPIELTENGQPRASILIPASPAPAPRLAALELQYCVRKISGATLPIRALDRPFSGVRILLDGAVFKEPQWRVTPQELDLRRYEYLIEFSSAGVVLLGRDARNTTGAEINYAQATGQSGSALKVKLPGMFDDQGTLARGL